MTRNSSELTTAALAMLWLTPLAGAQSVAANGIPIGPGADLSQLALDASTARVVHLKGDSADHGELLHKGRLEVIRALQHDADFDVLVLPIGIFEGRWLDDKLRANAKLREASTTVYRVWRESEAFHELLAYARDNGLEIAGGLCRYHAAGKELYAPHLIEFLDRHDLLDEGLADRIRALWGGRSRLSSAADETRRQALALAVELESRVDASAWPWEAHLIRNMKTFVELEMLRAGDLPDQPDFGLEEKRQNLDWFLATGYRDAKLIYWEGRGASSTLPTEATVYEIELTVTE